MRKPGPVPTPAPTTPNIKEPGLSPDVEMRSVRLVQSTPHQLLTKSGIIGTKLSRWCLSENHKWCNGCRTGYSLDFDKQVRAECECKCHGRFV